MISPLLGLESTLADEACDRVELRDSSRGVVQAFVRQDEDTWASDDPGAVPLHTRELCAQITEGFGQAYDRLLCFVGAEQVDYAVERGSVRVRRGPRAAGGPDPEPAGMDFEPLAEALGIPRSRRKAKFKQAQQFGRIVDLALDPKLRGEVRVLDLACGRSYLGFVLVQLLAARGLDVRLHGVDSDIVLVERCREIAEALGWPHSTFDTAGLETYAVEAGSYDIAVSLHGCDTLTDEAIRIACEARVPLVFVAPCCQHELRHQWRKHPLHWMARYGLLEQRLADVLTDGFRCLAMEALGYQVKAIRFTEPDVTPKNLLIQGRLTSGPRPARARDAAAFLKQFGVRPRLADLLEAAMAEGESLSEPS